MGLSDGLFPSALSLGDDEEVEEERRLCYVGITRAEEELYLSSAKNRMVNGQTQYFKISRFFEDIPDALLKKNLLYRPKRSEEELFLENSGKSYYNSYLKNAESSISSYLGRSGEGGHGTKGYSVDYQEGDRVKHTKFGEGSVLKIEEDVKDYLVTVLFDSAGQKKMMAGFAKLEKL